MNRVQDERPHMLKARRYGGWAHGLVVPYEVRRAEANKVEAQSISQPVIELGFP